MHEIHRLVPSSGPNERGAVSDGTASDEMVATTFPVLPGSHLDLRSPSLEFAKSVVHLASLETQVRMHACMTMQVVLMI